jgi:glycerol-3-phosphate dehydrogenase (NAD(P)+)
LNASTIAVLGAGSWGTALAVHLARNGSRVRLWGRYSAAIETLARERRNSEFLPDVEFPPSLEPIPDIEQAVAGATDVLIAVPSIAFRATLEAIAPIYPQGASVCWATKGLEQGSNKLLHEVVEDVLGTSLPTGVISGPTFAAEVARGLPTAVTVASTQSATASRIAQIFHSRTFRAYTSDDVIGVEIGGAIKNVLAIAAGIADGLGFGANARAALITRGLVEMTRFGVTLGGKRDTLLGLSGLGDLILTCTDDQSRNRRFGLAMGQGLSVEQALQSINQVVEGVQTAREVYELAKSNAVAMPIVEQVYAVIYQNVAPREAVQSLLDRAQKAENS